MIQFDDAYSKVLAHIQDFGTKTILLANANGRILAEDVLADRDFPPFNRATKDGIAFLFDGVDTSKPIQIEAVLAAGSPSIAIKNKANCVEIMTGAVVPVNADTVVMYEHIEIKKGFATLQKIPKKGQNIHAKGSDEAKGTVILDANTKISPAEIGVLASVGKSEVVVKKLPKITTIATGNELVEVDETPLPHQIRKSNMHSLYAALEREGISPKHLHLEDDKKSIALALQKALQENDVLLLSGGVSKGKYDFIPDAFQELGVEKVFHRIAQRPGKPFWFGVHKATNTVVFSFPGNPASTFANYHIYFKDWLHKSLGIPIQKFEVILNDAFENTTPLTRFLRVKTCFEKGTLSANIIVGNGSGDLTSLAKSDGFIRLKPNTNYKKGACVPFTPTRNII